ncbi:hypothetical protein E3N88_14980 [Mikania micrantha]|uniref:TLDc domain-containing protein n=1 Tax=Mikania micrantha TaxID=192012 RepID=A0A5N6P301_9ASTR|nr:hypothetical protein E3N88_14980 [Mikania micrantha]
MHSWKDRVTEKLTNLFSDSTSSSPSSPPHGSPHPHKVRSNKKDDGYFSSVLTFMRSSTEPSSNKHDNDLKPVQSLPKRWKSEDVSWRHMPLDTYDEDEDDGASDSHKQNGTQSPLREVSTAREENGDQGSARSSNSSEVFEDATEPNTPMRDLIDLTVDSFFISPDLYQFFQSSLPNIVKGCRWGSTLRHGISLRTLIRKSSDLSGPCLLASLCLQFQQAYASLGTYGVLNYYQEYAWQNGRITGDTQGAVFGGLLNGPLIPTPKRKYQGTYETFVFTTLYGAPRLFRPTEGANRYFYMCLNDLLALGGGGDFALRLDEDLLTGTSGRCDTFGSQCLAHDESFAVKNVELWGFAHSSRYL